MGFLPCTRLSALYNVCAGACVCMLWWCAGREGVHCVSRGSSGGGAASAVVPPSRLHCTLWPPSQGAAASASPGVPATHSISSSAQFSSANGSSDSCTVVLSAEQRAQGSVCVCQGVSAAGRLLLCACRTTQPRCAAATRQGRVQAALPASCLCSAHSQLRSKHVLWWHTRHHHTCWHSVERAVLLRLLRASLPMAS